MKNAAPLDYYPLLDVLRFCAAMLVVFYHFTYNAWPAGVAGAEPGLAGFGTTFSTGWIGVQIFFVLSGFVIAISSTGKTWRQFARSRVLRLYPAAFLCASLTALFMTSDPDLVPKYLRSIAIFPVGPWVEGVYWTLPVEILFYALIALWLALLPTRSVVLLGIVIGLPSTAYWVLKSLIVLRPGLDGGIVGFVDGAAYPLDALPHLVYFSIGIMIFSLSRAVSVPRLLVTALFLGTGAVAVVASALYQAKTGAAPAHNAVVAPAIWFVFVGAMMAIVLSKGRGTRRVERFHPLLRAMGLASYPLYLLHNQIGLAVIRVLDGAGPYARVALAVACVLALSHGVVLLEERLRNRLRRVI